QSNIGKERTEPGFRLDDAFKMLVALGPRNVGRTPGEQCPTRRRARQIAAPDLHDTGLARDGQKRRGEGLDGIRRSFLTELAKPWKLSPAQRIPIFGACVSPRDLDAVPNQAEAQRGVDVPPERRRSGDGFTITIAPHGKHAIGRAVSRPWSRGARDELVKSADGC